MATYFYTNVYTRVCAHIYTRVDTHIGVHVETAVYERCMHRHCQRASVLMGAGHAHICTHLMQLSVPMSLDNCLYR